jgi:hypothetical protein
MPPRYAALITLTAAALGLAATPAFAQSLGTLSWQLQPYCNNLSLNVTQQGALFTVDGFDDQCGAGQRAPLVGVATPNPDGTIGFGLHIITVPGGRPVDVDARIALATVSGPWTDSAGNSGNFAFNARTGGLPRPLPSAPGGAITPGSITSVQLAPAAVTSANLANGSVTPQKLSMALPKMASSGLTTGVIDLPIGSSQVVRTLTMTIPAAGQVMVNASGLFGFVTGSGFTQLAWCSISTGAVVETAHYLYARTDATIYGTALTNAPFAGARVFNVSPGVFTVNLACTASTTAGIGFEPTLQTAQISAIFIAS